MGVFTHTLSGGAIMVTEERHIGARVYEAVVGIVTDIKDDQKLCRVKVKIPSLPITDNTWWSSWISIGGAKDRGWFSLPEVDDEVLIMFEHGEIHRPIILGALWNGKDRPPSDNGDGKNNLRMLRRTVISWAASTASACA
mgnify:CR=1 FL=1